MVLRIDDFDSRNPIPINKIIIYIRDITAINYYQCPKKFCFFCTNDRRNMTKHENACQEETRISYKQLRKEKSIDHLKIELFKEGILPTENFESMYFCTYDIETLMQKPGPDFIVNLENIHRLATIGISTNFGEDRDFFLWREDMTPQSLKDLIKKFVDQLEFLRMKMAESLPESIP